MTDKIIGSWARLRAAIEAAPTGSSSAFTLTGAAFDCDYDQQINVTGTIASSPFHNPF
jgi:hypothetical protein